MFKKSREKSPYFLMAMDFGYMLLAAVGIFGGLGWWLDGKAGTAPLFLTGGIFLGLAVAFNSLLRRVNASGRPRPDAKKHEKEKPPKPGP